MDHEPRSTLELVEYSEELRSQPNASSCEFQQSTENKGFICRGLCSRKVRLKVKQRGLFSKGGWQVADGGSTVHQNAVKKL